MLTCTLIASFYQVPLRTLVTTRVFVAVATAAVHLQAAHSSAQALQTTHQAAATANANAAATAAATTAAGGAGAGAGSASGDSAGASAGGGSAGGGIAIANDAVFLSMLGCWMSMLVVAWFQDSWHTGIVVEQERLKKEVAGRDSSSSARKLQQGSVQSRFSSQLARGGADASLSLVWSALVVCLEAICMYGIMEAAMPGSDIPAGAGVSANTPGQIGF